jgi:hypothetical protein
MNRRRSLRRRLVDYNNPKSVSSRVRNRRLETLRSLIAGIAKAAAAPVCILDVGGTAAFWRLIGYEFLRTQGATVTLVNLQPIAVPADAAGVLSSETGDGCDLHQFADRSFDLGVSNSVIEHVGPQPRQALFAGELRRVCSTYYVQTPNFWFPLELHYVAPLVHWLPVNVRARLMVLGIIGAERRPRDVADARDFAGSIRLLTEKQMRALFPDACLSHEYFLGLRKSLIAVGGSPPPN